MHANFNNKSDLKDSLGYKSELRRDEPAKPHISMSVDDEIKFSQTIASAELSIVSIPYQQIKTRFPVIKNRVDYNKFLDETLENLNAVIEIIFGRLTKIEEQNATKLLRTLGILEDLVMFGVKNPQQDYLFKDSLKVHDGAIILEIRGLIMANLEDFRLGDADKRRISTFIGFLSDHEKGMFNNATSQEKETVALLVSALKKIELKFNGDWAVHTKDEKDALAVLLRGIKSKVMSGEENATDLVNIFNFDEMGDSDKILGYAFRDIPWASC